MLFALNEGDRTRAESEWQSARSAIADNNSRAWTTFGAAFLDDASFDQEIAAARAVIDGTPFGSDWELGANINYIQYLSLAIPRQFLPQVGYSEYDPILLRLLDAPDKLAALRAAVSG